MSDYSITYIYQYHNYQRIKRNEAFVYRLDASNYYKPFDSACKLLWRCAWI